MKIRTIFLLLVTATGSFLYGLFVYHKKLYPYHQLRKLRTLLASDPDDNLYDTKKSFNVLSKTESTNNSSIHFIYLSGLNHHATLIQTKGGENVLIGCGREKDSEILDSYLDRLGVDSLSGLVIPMYDKDHIGGLADIVHKFDIDRIFLEKTTNSESSPKKEQLLHTLLEGKQIAYPDVGEQVIISDNIHLKKLSPMMTFTQENTNLEKPDRCNSTVYQLVSPSFTALLMNDAQIPAEKKLVERETELSSDLLCVGHHGEGPVNSFEFLDEVDPAVSIINDSEYNDDTLSAKSKLEYLDDNTTYEKSRFGTVIVEFKPEMVIQEIYTSCEGKTI